MNIISTTPIHYRMRILWALFELTQAGETVTAQDLTRYFPTYPLLDYSLEGNVQLDRADMIFSEGTKRYKISTTGREFLFGYLKEISRENSGVREYVGRNFPDELSQSANASKGKRTAQEDKF